MCPKVSLVCRVSSCVSCQMAAGPDHRHHTDGGIRGRIESRCVKDGELEKGTEINTRPDQRAQIEKKLG